MITRLRLIRRRLGTAAKNSLAVVGLGASLYSLSEAYEYQQLDLDLNTSNLNSNPSRLLSPDADADAQAPPRKVLLIPFHQLHVLEQQKPPSLTSLLASSSSSATSSEDKVQPVEVRKLVQAIHQAAADPNVVAIYGTFGSGFRFASGGCAHLEEIRNAITVFNQSHRTHYEPQRRSMKNGRATEDDTSAMRPAENHSHKHSHKHSHNQSNRHQPQPSTPPAKYTYAYADTFDHPLDSLNQEYYIASSFSQIYMQPRGHLNLFGVATSSLFFKDALHKYGIKVHVFKHGLYKSKYYG